MSLLITLVAVTFIIFFSIYFVLLSRKARAFPELCPESYVQDDQIYPKVSVILSVKDEAHHVEGCVRSLLSLSYPDLEIVVVNDRSSDSTGRILATLEKEFPVKLKVTEVSTVPVGWGGQNHAFWRGVSISTGDWFCFTDADCRFDSVNIIEQAYLDACANGVCFISILPRMNAPTLWEKIYLPICSFLFLQGLAFMSSNEPNNYCASAYGPFMLMTRRAYFKMGGHQRVRYLINGDIAFARIAKTEGLKFRLVGNRNLCSTHMYCRISASWFGWTRNFYNSIQSPGRLVTMFALALALLIPWPLLLIAMYFSAPLAIGLSAGCVVILHLSLARLYMAFGLSSLWSFVYLPGMLWSAAITFGAWWKAIRRAQTYWHGIAYPAPCRIPPQISEQST